MTKLAYGVIGELNLLLENNYGDYSQWTKTDVLKNIDRALKDMLLGMDDSDEIKQVKKIQSDQNEKERIAIEFMEDKELNNSKKIKNKTPRIRVEVPPTMEVGSYVTYVSGEYNQTIQKEALQDYNNARSHDGLPPIRKMPNGTKYYKENVGKNSDGTDNFIYSRVK